MQEILHRAKKWLQEPFDHETRKEIRDLMERDPNQLEDRFYKDLAFGTGGMRGVMGAGTNRINRYTLGKATQGLSNYLKKQFPGKQLKVAIAYDCRHNSKRFARIVAEVFTANDIEVFLFDELRPTPELSFAVRYLACQAGIVLTASHNPPEYNGYKVYFDDGAQIVPPHDSAIIEQVQALDFVDIRFEAKPELIHIVGDEIDRQFIKASINEGTFDDTEGRADLKIVFTSLHGTSIQLIPDALRLAGYSDVHIVREQARPDGDFPTVRSPNPEEPEALKMAIDLADRIQADIVIGTDPDSDRIGIAVRNDAGQMQLLNGNQTMCLMTDFLIRQWKKQGRLTGRQFVASTIVSTELMKKIAASYGVRCKVGLTGFKWIAKMIRDAEGSEEFIGGGEESFGYMVGDFVRDKDAVTATLLACEIAASAKAKGSTMYRELTKLYLQHGYHKEHLLSIVKKGKEGADQIAQLMSDWRNNPPKMLDGAPVVKICDYQSSLCHDILNGRDAPIDIPKSNVLIYHASDGTTLAARPSGTEPKIKFYIGVQEQIEDPSDTLGLESRLSKKIERITQNLKP